MSVLVGLGANVGDPPLQLTRAIDLLGQVVWITAVSNVYLTEPVGFSDQPDFFNLALSATTELTVFELHALTVRIEQRIGRLRSVPNGPRRIDVDLLAYGALAFESDDLTIPHPRMHQRRFVLAPLAEIAPDWTHPISGRTVLESLAELSEGGVVTSLGAL